MSFSDHFKRDALPEPQPQSADRLSQLEGGAQGIAAFMSTFAGASYERGLYRILNVAEMEAWTKTVTDVFPHFRGRVLCFGFDWLGRCFAMDFARAENEQFLILMFEPGTGEALEIPASFSRFHDTELLQFRDEALASRFYREWRSKGGASPLFDQCVGYKTPLFLNGGDTVENLEVVDLDVYWSICGQLLLALRNHSDTSHIQDDRDSDHTK